MKFHFNEKSTNKKIGKIPVITSPKETCPEYCGLYDSCYAKFGPMNFFWKKVTEKTIPNLYTKQELFNKLKELPKDTVIRVNQAGDLPQNKSGKLDRNFMRSFIASTKHLKPIIYTHVNDLDYIRKVNSQGLNVIYSLNSLGDVKPVDVPLSIPISKKFAKKKNESLTEFRSRISSDMKDLRSTLSDEKVTGVLCPATYMDTDCKECRICCSLKAGNAVLFPVHGVGAKRYENKHFNKGIIK